MDISRTLFEGERQPVVGATALVDVVTRLARLRALWERASSSPGEHREGLRLVATDDYEAWLLAWPPGSRVKPHDHGDSSGAFVVGAGELTEVRWAGPLRRERRRRLGIGDAVTIPAGTVHDVVAAGPGIAWSIHAYSPRLREMRFYDDAARCTTDVESVPDGPGLLDARLAASLLHPSSGWSG